MKTLLRVIERLKWLPSRLGRKEDKCATLVQAFYRTAFGRSADPAGLAHYVPRLRAGLPLEIFARELTKSEEFQAHFGSSPIINAEFLNNLYRYALGRPPDPAGFDWWVAEGE